MTYLVSQPVRSPIRYVGSKRRLAKAITGFMPAHTTYVEPFGGSAAVMLAKCISPVEVFNDFDGSLVNFFEVCRDQHDRLVAYLRLLPYARSTFEKWKKEPLSEVADPFERAVRYFFLNRVSFAAKLQTGECMSFGFGIVANPAEAYARSIEFIPSFARRILTTQIENRPWQYIIDAYDRPDTLFMIDPPYWGAEQYYTAVMKREEHVEMAERLSRIQGHAMVCYYEGPEVEAMYGPAGLGWTKKTFKLASTIGKLNAGDKANGTAHNSVATEVLYISPSRHATFDSMWAMPDVQTFEADESEDPVNDIVDTGDVNGAAGEPPTDEPAPGGDVDLEPGLFDAPCLLQPA